MMIPNSNTSPTFAFSSLAITTGPGCGGKKPCVTDKAVTIGKPNLSGDTFARLAIVNTNGINNTKPTSKNNAIPTINAATNIAHCTCLGPNLAINVSAIRFAPPPSASIYQALPLIQRLKQWPSVLPIPASIVSIILFNGMPSNIAVTTDVTINEINVFNFKNIINDNSNKIPITTLISGQISPNIVNSPNVFY